MDFKNKFLPDQVCYKCGLVGHDDVYKKKTEGEEEEGEAQLCWDTRLEHNKEGEECKWNRTTRYQSQEGIRS